MENSGGKFRKKKIYFTQVSNNILRDNTISLKAKGLYSLIQSYITIENFTLYKNYLKKQCKEGEKAFESTWKELKDNGYLIQYRLQDEKTKQFYYEYELLDEKNIELANEIHSNQNRKKHEEKSHTPKKEGMDNNSKAIPPKKEGMGNGLDGKGEGYNNTVPSNTDLNNITSSSSSDLLEEFETNICKLKRTTKEKFIKIINNHDKEFIQAIINECSTTNVNCYKGFETALESYVNRNCKTAEDVYIAAEKYRAAKKKNAKKSKSNSKIKKDSFTDYEQRDYDFEDLEKKLLGWDKK